jgi:hypothetical protein
MVLPVRELRALLTSHSVSAAGAVEKADLARLVLGVLQGSGGGSASSTGSG